MRSMLKIQSLHFFLIFVHDLERLSFFFTVHDKQQKKVSHLTIFLQYVSTNHYGSGGHFNVGLKNTARHDITEFEAHN